MMDTGRVVVVDRVLPPEGDPGHRSAAFLDIFFLVMEGGRIRTIEDFDKILDAAGFHLTRTAPVGGGFHVLEYSQ
jgi:hypothetical protein